MITPHHFGTAERENAISTQCHLHQPPTSIRRREYGTICQPQLKLTYLPSSAFSDQVIDVLVRSGPLAKSFQIHKGVLRF